MAQWSHRPTKAGVHAYKDGDTRMDAAGYVLERRSNHPAAHWDGFVPQHRLVVEKRLGRYLSGMEAVHHINKIRSDNRDENLRLFPTHSEHIGFHHLQKAKIHDPSLIAAVIPLAADPHMTLQDAARRLGMCWNTVRKLCDVNSIQWVSAQIVPVTEEQVKQALQGRTTLEAAKVLGCGHMTLRRRFEHLLAKRRTPTPKPVKPDGSPDVPARKLRAALQQREYRRARRASTLPHVSESPGEALRVSPPRHQQQ